MDLLCERCGFKFTQKSSLLRHRKRCQQGGVTKSARQKSCSECALAKTRCDLRRPVCSRCSIRSTSCQYKSSHDSPHVEDCGVLQDSTRPQLGVSSAMTTTALSYQPHLNDCPFDQISSASTSGLSSGFFPNQLILEPSFDIFAAGVPDNSASALQLVSGVEGNSLLASKRSPATRPVLVHHSMEFILRSLRTWPRIMSKGIDLPPIIHPSQIADTSKSSPLSNCFTLVRMWSGQCPGALEMVTRTINQEMQKLLETYQTMEEDTLLAAIQAVCIYTLLLLFPSPIQTSLPVLASSTFRSLRAIVYHTVATGLILEAETSHQRPDFETWVHISTKRRSVLALYLIQWSYSIYHCLPSFDCAELGFMPAPAADYLWRETDKKKWEALYNRWLAQWEGGQYYQWELFIIENGVRMNDRAELWMEDCDDFGKLFMAIVNANEREPGFETVHD